MSTLDTVLIVSLASLAFCFLVFILFFVPVLLQLRKTLQALQELLNTFNDYSLKLNRGLSSVSNSIKQTRAIAGSIFSAMRMGLAELFSSHKSRH